MESVASLEVQPPASGVKWKNCIETIVIVTHGSLSVSSGKNMLDVTSKTPEAWEISRATPLELGISEVFKGDGLGANSQTELYKQL